MPNANAPFSQLPVLYPFLASLALYTQTPSMRPGPPPNVRLSATASLVEAVEWVLEARNDSRGGVAAKMVEEDMTSMPYRC